MMSRKCRAMAHRWKWPLEDGMRALINFCVFCVRFSVCVMYVKWHVCFAGECPSYFYRRYRQTVLVHLACVCAGCCCSNPTIASKKRPTFGVCEKKCRPNVYKLNWSDACATNKQQTANERRRKHTNQTESRWIVYETISHFWFGIYLYILFLSVLSDCRVGLEFNSNFGSCFVPDAVL